MESESVFDRIKRLEYKLDEMREKVISQGVRIEKLNSNQGYANRKIEELKKELSKKKI